MMLQTGNHAAAVHDTKAHACANALMTCTVTINSQTQLQSSVHSGGTPLI